MSVDITSALQLQCLTACQSSGQTIDQCTAACTPASSSNSWGFLQWVGFTVIVGVTAFAGYKLYQNKRDTGKFFPQLHEHDAFSLPE